MTQELKPLIDMVACQSKSEIGINDNEIERIKAGLILENLAKLIELGWTDEEIKDLLLIIFISGDEIQIGVFGSMSRGEQREDSDVDVLIETEKNKLDHELEPVAIYDSPGKFSNRKFNLFVVPHNFAPAMFNSGQKKYNEVIWVYADKEKLIKMQIAKLARRWTGKSDAEIANDVYGF